MRVEHTLAARNETLSNTIDRMKLLCLRNRLVQATTWRYAMKCCFRLGWDRLGSPRRLRRLVSLLSGGVLLQATAGGCGASLSSIAEALWQPLVTGIGNGLSSLAEALVLNAFV
jgi:hypothetical protein